jgi:pimeloyl-ACP methyl ester carboxylesterase
MHPFKVKGQERLKMSYLKNFHFQLVGLEDGYPLVFLHGLMGYSQNWRKISVAFEQSHRILLLDQRGHGRSFKPQIGYAPEDYSEDLLKIIDELGWVQIDLVGHSMGGRNAMNFAHRFPSRVHKLIIEDIGPDADASAIARIRYLLEIVPTPFASKEKARIFFTDEFVEKAKDYPQPKALGQYFYANMEMKADGSTDWRFSKEAILMSLEEGRSRDRWNEIDQLGMPCLVVRGEFSVDLKSSVFEEILRRNSKICGVEIPKSGHWVHFDQPELFIKALKDFLKSP